ncbi:Ltp family lipoprotein [Ligilactobacillus salivarius]|uniref:Ltp family lipoprotein n=1 Tax=Ligilactobacillus salivarius TaxID=1624 RepID=A0AAX3X7N6_9LACO|nr:Ltp family lipoprotein [Ligilactobacillus salivarius]WII29404.1 Ltp family lipoprotein [Ligilactobacillus salivarius]
MESVIPKILGMIIGLGIAYLIFKWNKKNKQSKIYYAIAFMFLIGGLYMPFAETVSPEQEAIESSKAESSSIKESERKESISIEEDAKSSSLSEKKASSIKAKQSSAKSSESSSKKIPREYVSALIKGQEYADSMYMSKKAVYNQLTSDYGEKFSSDAANYAIANIKANWNKNALHKAKEYQEEQNMSPDAIYDQLTSDYGEQFTPDEANYAIQHLNK